MTNLPDVADHAPTTMPATAVEPKVVAGTVAAASSSAVVLPFVLWLLAAYVFRGDVPLPVQGMAGLLITGASTFVAGYRARHVDRTP